MNLRLFQISDSALPISGYTHSWGLEAAIASKSVNDPASLERWVSWWLRTALGPLEGVLVLESCRAIHANDHAKIPTLNELADVSIMPPTIRRASREMGEQLLELGSTWNWSRTAIQPFRNESSTTWHHSVVYGMLGAIAEASPLETVSAFLHQAALGVIGAGVRAIPVGHTHGQQVLAYLHNEISDLSKNLNQQTLETVGSGCPYYEVLCDEQTRLYARMFRS
jgi:urease accessory protein